MKLFNLNTIFNFGKFKGKTLKEIIDMEYSITTLDGRKIKLMSESPSYLNWCSINLDYFVLSKKTIEDIKKNQYPSYFSNKALKCLEHKYKTWLEDKDSKNLNYNHIENNDIYSSEDNYCGACMESPCMCSDPYR